MARIFPELLAAQKGVTTSTVESHESSLYYNDPILKENG